MIRPIPLALALMATTTLFVGSQVVAQTAPAGERAELTRADAEARALERFERLDANKDGALSEADREAQARLRFDATDTDGNGELSFAEVTAAREARHENRAERMAERGERRAGMRGMRGKRGGERGGLRGRMLERADADSNGSVSQAEFTSAALARFDRLDANNDGTITADERRSHRGERGQRRGQRG